MMPVKLFKFWYGLCNTIIYDKSLIYKFFKINWLPALILWIYL